MRDPLRLAILGLPGAGKTTLAQELARLLRGHLLSTGGALRAVAAADSSLAASLAAGSLGPEELVMHAVQEAVRAAGTSSLIVDGFPRHAAQVVDADRLLGPWVPLLVEVDPQLATDRLATRALLRPEDSAEVAQGRVRRSKDDLGRVVRALQERGTNVLRIDGAGPSAEVVQRALTVLETIGLNRDASKPPPLSNEGLSTTARRE